MSPSINWIDRDFADIIHRQSIEEHGGAAELRDESALLAGLMRAQNLHAYGDPPPDIADLAAIYAGGIVLNHPFVDGNKRTGFMTAYMFIVKNGYELNASEAETVLWTLKLAARACEKSDYAGWLRANMKNRPKSVAPQTAAPAKTVKSSKPAAQKKMKK